MALSSLLLSPSLVHVPDCLVFWALGYSSSLVSWLTAGCSCVQALYTDCPQVIVPRVLSEQNLAVASSARCLDSLGPAGPPWGCWRESGTPAGVLHLEPPGLDSSHFGPGWSPGETTSNASTLGNDLRPKNSVGEHRWEHGPWRLPPPRRGPQRPSLACPSLARPSLAPLPGVLGVADSPVSDCSRSQKKMQMVSNISFSAMFVMYFLTAIFGYLTFYGE